MTNDHDAVRMLLGGYVLGGLDAGDRRSVEDHLSNCSDCRDEVAELAVLPGLLHRLSPEEAAGLSVAPPPRKLLESVTRDVLQQRRRRRRLTVVGGLVAAAVTVIAVVFGIQATLSRPTPAVATVVSLDPSTGPGHGEAQLVAKQWGTSVTLQAWQLPAQGPFELEIVGADGKSECAAVWGRTKDGHAIVTGATSLHPEEIRSMTVKGAGDVVLMGR
jgi:anti-sigma-K factor RskA